MTQPSEKLTYTQSWDLPHPIEKVWNALTDSSLLEKWIMPNDLKPIVGHKFTFRTEPTQWWDGIVHCEVREIQFQKLLKYSWQGGKNRTGGFGVDTVVTWTLKPTNEGGTQLSIEQAGFNKDAIQAYSGAKMGWQRNIENLGRLLIQGKGEIS